MKIAVVILNWNGIDYLRQFLPAVIERSNIPDVEIIVADNASTDGSVEMMRVEFPKVRILVLDQNYGFAGGYNKALQQVEAEYFILLNSDVEVAHDWLKPLVQYMDTHPETAACQPKILSWYRKSHFEHAGASGGYIDFLGYPFCRGRVLAECEMDEGQYDDIREVFWATGACLMIRSAVFHAVGGLDDDFFAHMEEIDLCWRIKSRGMGIVCIPESKVFHVGGGTLNVESPRKTYLNFRNNLLLLYKNLPDSSLNHVLFVRWVLDYVAAFQLIVTGKPKNGLAVFSARRDFVRMKKDFEQKRADNLSSATVHAIPQVLNKSIIFSYYLKGIKKYSRLFL